MNLNPADARPGNDEADRTSGPVSVFSFQLLILPKPDKWSGFHDRRVADCLTGQRASMPLALYTGAAAGPVKNWITALAASAFLALALTPAAKLM